MAFTEDEQVSLEELAFGGRLRSAPISNITIEIKDGQIILDGSESQPAPHDGSPINAWYWSARDSNPLLLTILEPAELYGHHLTGEINARRLVLEAPARDGEYFISLRVEDQAALTDRSQSYFVVQEGQPRMDDWSWENTDWVEPAVVYGVIPRNFGDRGYLSIIDRLDDLKDLGVAALWLSPVNTTPPNNFGYHVLNYFELNDRYGTKEEFRRMVDEAHRRGIRVMMDFVPNHTSEHHRFFQDTLQKGKESRYWNFFDRDESGTHTHYFHWTYLPNLNFNNPEVVRWITEAFAYWVREFDVDGFRVDVAWGIRQRNPDYWPMWRQTLKRIKPDLLLLAEAGAHDPYYFTEGYDAAYDWTDELGHGAWEKVFEDPAQLTERLHAALTNEGRGFHEDALVFHFLNNNDTAERFITRYGVGMTRVATAMLLTLPGIPCVYTGDEIGAEFLPYKNPEPIHWDADPHNLRPFHKKLIALRKSVRALHSRKWEILPVEPRQQVYGYLRYAEWDEPPVLVLLNFSDEPAEAVFTLPEGAELLNNLNHLRDLITDNNVAVNGKDTLTVQVQPKSAYLLTTAQR